MEIKLLVSLYCILPVSAQFVGSGTETLIIMVMKFKSDNLLIDFLNLLMYFIYMLKECNGF